MAAKTGKKPTKTATKKKTPPAVNKGKQKANAGSFSKDRPGPGRPKGSRNRVTCSLRDATMLAFAEIGGKDWLVWVSKRYPVDFLRHLGRLIPREIAVTSTTTAPPPSLNDPAVMAAALALDLAHDHAHSHPPGAGETHAPDVPVGTVPPCHPEAPAAPPNGSIEAIIREAMQAVNDSNAPTACQKPAGQ